MGVGGEQTPVEKTETLNLNPPAMVIKNCGGHEVDINCQTTITLGCKNHKNQVTILVQKGNPMEVLGTDILGKLGFNTFKVEEDG